MTYLHTLLQLLRVFGQVSVSAFGGITVALPHMELEVVQSQHWLDQNQFANTYALGQLVPGPGTTFVAAIGFKAAGVGGALVSLIAIYLPAGVLAYAAGSRWDSLRNWGWHEAIQRGLTPVVAGLLLAASYFLLRATVTNLATAAIAAAATLLLLSRRANPMLIVLGGGVAGWLLYH